MKYQIFEANRRNNNNDVKQVAGELPKTHPIRILNAKKKLLPTTDQKQFAFFRFDQQTMDRE